MRRRRSWLPAVLLYKESQSKGTAKSTAGFLLMSETAWTGFSVTWTCLLSIFDISHCSCSEVGEPELSWTSWRRISRKGHLPWWVRVVPHIYSCSVYCDSLLWLWARKRDSQPGRRWKNSAAREVLHSSLRWQSKRGMWQQQLTSKATCKWTECWPCISSLYDHCSGRRCCFLFSDGFLCEPFNFNSSLTICFLFPPPMSLHALCSPCCFCPSLMPRQ